MRAAAVGLLTLLAALVGQPAPDASAQPASVCVADAGGDQRARVNPDGPLDDIARDAPAADLLRACLDGDVVHVAVVEPGDPTADAAWIDGASSIIVGIDRDLDGVGDAYVVLGVLPDSTFAAVVVGADEQERCRVEAVVTDDGYEATLPGECADLGGAAVQASARLDADPTDPLAPTIVDVAPDTGGFVTPEGGLVGAPPGPSRLAGQTRIDTAVAIARGQFPAGADSVYLARADVLVDAVAGGMLRNGPTLLVPSCGTVPAPVTAEIARLDPSRLVALGGPAAVCEETLVAAAGGRPSARLAGADRIATAAEIAAAAFPVGASEAYLARADVFADAVAAGSLTEGPVLLVPTCGEVPAVVALAVRRLVPERVVALGGTAAVCDEVLEELAGDRPALRLAGADRFATAAAIAAHGYPGGAATVFLARADVFADSVAGGSLTAGPTLLVPSCGALPETVTAALEALRPDRVVALGGPAAVCDEVLTAAAG